MTKQENLKTLINDFNTDKPDFTNLIPYLTGEPEVDLEDFGGSLIGKWGAIKTLWQLSRPEKPISRSRVWESPRGYRFLVQWSNLVLLRILVRKLSGTLPKSEYRLKNQINDAARSSVSNLEEGWKRSNTNQYLEFLSFTQGSLEEVKGDVDRMLQDGFIKTVKGSSLSHLGIDLKEWNNWAKNPLNSSKILYFPLKSNKGGYRTLKEIKGEDLTYEILMELINKTDWNLRKLVASLEKKQNQEKKFYQVEKARIKDYAKAKS